MSLRDDLRAPFWRAMFWTAVWLALSLARFMYEEGLSDGRRETWEVALPMMREMRAYYDADVRRQELRPGWFWRGKRDA